MNELIDVHKSKGAPEHQLKWPSDKVEDADKALAHDSRLDEISHQYEELVKDRQNLIKDLEKIYPAPLKDETLDGNSFCCEDPATGEKVVVKGITELDVVKINLEQEKESNRLLHRSVARLSCENSTLHRKVNDLGHKFCRARRERDQLAEKLRKAEREAHFYRSLVLEKLSQLIDEECKC